MTAKKKAESLVNNFHNELLVNDFLQSYYAAKKCAKIAVEELIKEQTMWQNGDPKPVLFWQDVLKEIDNI